MNLHCPNFSLLVMINTGGSLCEIQEIYSIVKLRLCGAISAAMEPPFPIFSRLARLVQLILSQKFLSFGDVFFNTERKDKWPLFENSINSDPSYAMVGPIFPHLAACGIIFSLLMYKILVSHRALLFGPCYMTFSFTCRCTNVNFSRWNMNNRLLFRYIMFHS